jgi:hypothetical protein
MLTECIQTELDLGRSGGRKLVGAFDGGAITSNGGVVLVAGVDRQVRLAERLAACFTDHRMAEAIKHALPDLLRQRIFGLALGYEDLIDHDKLRHDPALAAVIDKPGGTLAGKSTLNRLEHASKIGQDRHHKLDHDGQAIERLFVDLKPRRSKNLLSATWGSSFVSRPRMTNPVSSVTPPGSSRNVVVSGIQLSGCASFVWSKSANVPNSRMTPRLAAASTDLKKKAARNSFGP